MAKNLAQKVGKSVKTAAAGIVLAGALYGCSAETYDVLPWNDCGISGHEYENCRQKNDAPEYRKDSGIWN